MAAYRVQLSRKKGWRMPANTTKVDRGTIYGNPFPVTKIGSQWRVLIGCVAWWFDTERDAAAAAVHEFENWLYGFPTHREFMPDRRKNLLWALPAEAGRNLGCWCKLDMPCHADVLLRFNPALLVDAQSTLPTPERAAPGSSEGGK